MIKDCEKGKIDLVITKSVSRFCRNTLDGLDYVRRLKRWGVGVFFERENVNTLYMDNEMILTFMMSQAQAESESLSGNVQWGHRKNFRDGKVYYSYKNFLGYQRGADGQPEIAPEEAAIVRRIFARYLLGQSAHKIAADLTSDGFKTVRGNDVWSDSVIQRILQNEKYMGDALLQKTFSEDLFTRKRIKNNGQLPKYYVHNCHPAIIDRKTFQKVQEEIARHSSIRRTSDRTETEFGKYSGKYVLSELLVCGECGSPYRRVIWTQKGEKRVVWRCINRLEHGKRICKHSPTWDEGDIHTAVISAINERLDHQEVKKALDMSLSTALVGNAGEMTLQGIEVQLKKLQERQTELLHLAFSAGADCVDYDEEFQKVNLEMMRLTDKRAEMKDQQSVDRELEIKMEMLGNALSHISNRITTFDEVAVRQLVSGIKVLDKERLLVCFRDGEEIIAEKE